MNQLDLSVFTRSLWCAMDVLLFAQFGEVGKNCFNAG
jgi:hypothetical protein